MPDIVMCRGGECADKETCYRYRADPSEFRQAYFSVPPVKHGYCNNYAPVRMDDEKEKD